ncbi:MAG: hypothetical protein HUJ98_04095, partial [Bacteroidaceae bacterium]|nr:hypothetical protein [Bacteroidaceae bacterium]
DNSFTSKYLGAEVEALLDSIGMKVSIKNKNDQAYVFTTFKGWLSDATAESGQPSCQGVVKFAAHQCPLSDYTAPLQCKFQWMAATETGGNSPFGMIILWPYDFTSSTWCIVQRVNNSWKDPVMFVNNITSANNTWTGTNNFTGTLQKNGVNIATTNDLTSKENTSNKTTTISAQSTDTQYPSALGVYNYVENKIGEIEQALSEV